MFKKRLLAIIFSMIILSSVTTQGVAAAFTDVTDHTYEAAIDFCQEKGYVNGISETLFAPEGNLSRMQLATVWCRFLGISTVNHTFKDVTHLKNYYDSAAIIMNNLGILTGTSATSFSPYANVTREQLAIIVQRTFGVAAANENDYMAYSDHAAISPWARNAISACLNADVFAGLYNGPSLQPQKAATRAEICKLIYNLSQPAYTVTIGEMTGGTITALPSVAHPGTTITLNVVPDEGKQLKAGTLKFNDTVLDALTFTMPAEDVLITAEFEDVPVQLESISVTTPPDKATYTVGEALDLTGLVVTATYTDSTTNEVTGYTTTPAEGATLDTEGAISITVSFTEGTITKETTFDVQVNPAA